jgi:hypothetical protein
MNCHKTEKAHKLQTTNYKLQTSKLCASVFLSSVSFKKQTSLVMMMVVVMMMMGC